jgi:hypothetical protein
LLQKLVIVAISIFGISTPLLIVLALGISHGLFAALSIYSRPYKQGVENALAILCLLINCANCICGFLIHIGMDIANTLLIPLGLLNVVLPVSFIMIAIGVDYYQDQKFQKAARLAIKKKAEEEKRKAEEKRQKLREANLAKLEQKKIVKTAEITAPPKALVNPKGSDTQQQQVAGKPQAQQTPGQQRKSVGQGDKSAPTGSSPTQKRTSNPPSPTAANKAGAIQTTGLKVTVPATVSPKSSKSASPTSPTPLIDAEKGQSTASKQSNEIKVSNREVLEEEKKTMEVSDTLVFSLLIHS